MKKRLRQHVNPLAIGYQKAHEALDWPAIFADPSLPLLVDVGAGYGRFALKYAKERLGENVLGIEIRRPAVERAQKCASHAARGFEHCCAVQPLSLGAADADQRASCGHAARCKMVYAHSLENGADPLTAARRWQTPMADCTGTAKACALTSQVAQVDTARWPHLQSALRVVQCHAQHEDDAGVVPRPSAPGVRAIPRPTLQAAQPQAPHRAAAVLPRAGVCHAQWRCASLADVPLMEVARWRALQLVCATVACNALRW